jgi:alpha-glucosidase (family GH31 glycosyl hydrolase)
VLGEDRIITARPVDNYGLGLGGDAAAFAPVEINWAGWVGDQDPDFGGLRAALNNLYFSAEYGYVASGSDIGGYREDDSELGRDAETFVRWAQLGALCPVMENGGGGEHRPWVFGTEVEDIYRDFVSLHYALLPYLMAEGGLAFSEGRSLMDFQDDETYAYLLGRDVFVAPILEEGGAVTVTFPEGDWAYLFDTSRAWSTGDSETLTLPLDEFPVFVRQGSEIASTLAAGY